VVKPPVELRELRIIWRLADVFSHSPTVPDDWSR
jgi:hypothetical protein